jgi:hypothetical protein
MGLSPTTIQGEAVTEGKNQIRELRSASTDDQPKHEPAVAKEDSGVEAKAEQATSLKDYFVRLQHRVG